MSGTIVGGEFINPQKLEQKLAKAFETWTQFDVNDYFRDQFLEDKWPYDGETERKNKEAFSHPKITVFLLHSKFFSSVNLGGFADAVHFTKLVNRCAVFFSYG